MPSNPRKHKERAQENAKGRRCAEAAARSVLQIEETSSLEVNRSTNEVAHSYGARSAPRTATSSWKQFTPTLGTARWTVQNIWSNGPMGHDDLHRVMEPTSSAGTRPASAYGDGPNSGVDLPAHAVHLLALPSLDAPPSLEAPPSQEETPPSPVKSVDLIHRLLEVRAYLRSAQSLSEELERLHSRQQKECSSLERRIYQEYQCAYELSQLSC